MTTDTGKTVIDGTDAQAWRRKIDRLLTVLGDTPTTEAINILMYAVAGAAFMNGVTKEDLTDGLGATYDVVEENWVMSSESFH